MVNYAETTKAVDMNEMVWYKGMLMTRAEAIKMRENS